MDYLYNIFLVTSANSEVSDTETSTDSSKKSQMKNKKKISHYIIKCNNNSSFIIIISADKKAITINVQNTEKIDSSFFEGIFYFDKLIKIDKYFENFENNFSLYSYFNYIFKNNKVSFNYKDGDLNIRMKFKVHQKLKEITFPLEKRNINLEQALLINKVQSKLVTNLQEKLKRKNEEIIYLKSGKEIEIDSKILENEVEINFINKAMKEEDENIEEIVEEDVKDKDSDSKKSRIEIEYKLLFNITIYDENLINQLIDFATNFNNQCLAIVEFENKKICIVFTHKKEGNYFLLLKDSQKHNIIDFYIDKEKFYFKLKYKGNTEIINIYSIREFIQMEFFNCLITKK